MTDKSAKVVKKVKKYINLIETGDSESVRHAVDRLEKVDMTVDCLQSTGIGRILNNLRHRQDVGTRASELVERWRAMAQEAARLIRELSPSRTEQKKVKKEKRPKPNMDSFEAQLMAMDREPEKKKRKIEKPKSTAPDADDIMAEVAGPSSFSRQTTYPSAAVAKAGSPESDAFFDPTQGRSNVKTRMFAGRKNAANSTKTSTVPTMMTLVEICQKSMKNNIQLISYVGLTPYRLLKPILDMCTVQQLHRITGINRQLWEDLDPVWEEHTKKSFKFPKLEGDECWYQCYRRMESARTQKLKRISKEINSRHSTQQQSTSKTELVDVINPAFARKRQIRNGIAPANAIGIPNALEVSRARRTGTTSALPSGVKGSRISNNTVNRTQSMNKPKTGHLMAKTLKMLKGRR